jgi:hypothetical protein
MISLISVSFLNYRIRAKSADFSGRGLGGFKKLLSFFGREIKAIALKVVKLDIFGHLQKTTLILANATWSEG